MCKNEKKRLHVTLQSVVGYVKSIVCFDTGSTDNTLELIRDFCKENDIILRLKQGEFVDFSTSRNISLDFADTFNDIDYLLLMDVNDELRNGNKLLEMCEKYRETEYSGFLLSQEWWSGKMDKYYNMRLVKPRNHWRYKGVVHEYMTQLVDEKEKTGRVRFPNDVVLYQDRTQDDDKSSKRYVRDKELLLQEHAKDPKEPRTIFYLAQTFSCLGEHEDAYKYYLLRTTVNGFTEEVFESYLRAGKISKVLKHDWHERMALFMKAYEHSKRAEPLIEIAQYYIDKKNWELAFIFCNLACETPYPEKAILFVNKVIYEYKRWHMLGIIGWYAKKYDKGREGCLKAIEYAEANNIKTELDVSNLKFYEDHIKTNTKKMSKKEFIKNESIKLKKEFPKMSDKQILSKTKELWKSYR